MPTERKPVIRCSCGMAIYEYAMPVHLADREAHDYNFMEMLMEILGKQEGGEDEFRW